MGCAPTDSNLVWEWLPLVDLGVVLLGVRPDLQHGSSGQQGGYAHPVVALETADPAQKSVVFL